MRIFGEGSLILIVIFIFIFIFWFCLWLCYSLYVTVESSFFLSSLFFIFLARYHFYEKDFEPFAGQKKREVYQILLMCLNSVPQKGKLKLK